MDETTSMDIIFLFYQSTIRSPSQSQTMPAHHTHGNSGEESHAG